MSDHCCFAGCTLLVCGCCARYGHERNCPDNPFVLNRLDSVSRPLPRPCLAERDRDSEPEVGP